MATQHSARADLALGLGTALLSALVFWEALGLPPPVYDPVGAGGIVKGVAALLFGLALALSASGLRRSLAAAEPAGGETPGASASALPLALLLLAYVGAMQWQVLRFQEATVILVLAYSGLMRRPTPRAMLLLAPIALLVGYGGHWVFTRVFLVSLPS